MRNLLVRIFAVLCILVPVTAVTTFAKGSVFCHIDVSAGEIFSITEPNASTFVMSEGLDIVNTITKNGERIGYDLMAKNAGNFTVFVTYPDVRFKYDITVHPFALSEEARALYEELSASWDEDLDPLRKQIVYTALSGLGNISYMADDDSNYMEDAPDGLSCSGFVAWVYYHTGIEDFGKAYTADSKEAGDTNAILYEELLPGDIGSWGTKEDGHCAIYAGQADGKDIWIQCISESADTSDNSGTGVTLADERTNFTHFYSYAGFSGAEEEGDINIQDD